MLSLSTRIRAVSFHKLDIPMREAFAIAGGTQDVAQNVLVTIELADGARGYGEAAPLPAFNGETQHDACKAIEAARALIENADAREWRHIASAMKSSVDSSSARCAIETAILDALCRHDQRSLWDFFGGAVTRLETDMTVTTPVFVDRALSIAHAARSAGAIVSRGIRVIKVKVGAADVQFDVERLEAIQAQAPGVRLILDGNGGYNADQSLDLLGILQTKNIMPILFEQPVRGDDLEGLKKVTDQGGVPVAADESASDLASATRVIEAKAAHVINIKLMKCGVADALEIAALCRAAKVGLMIGGMVESVLAMSMSACFAAGLGGFDYIDLDTPFFMASNPFEGGCYPDLEAPCDGWLDLKGIREGHGVSPKKSL